MCRYKAEGRIRFRRGSVQAMYAPQRPGVCCGTRESAGRSTLGMATIGLAVGALLYFVVEQSSRQELPGLPDDAGNALMWSDFAAATLTLGAGFMLLFPCCSADLDTVSLRRERNVAAALLLFATVLTSITARVRDVNLKLRQDEAYVCGRIDDPLACPFQRVTLSEAYNTWRKGSEDITECWFNTSAVIPDAYTFGQQYFNATIFPTSNFADPDTYVRHPEYAPCFYYGCDEQCLPDQAAQQARLLRFEVLVSVVAFVGATVTLCTRTNYDVVAL